MIKSKMFMTSAVAVTALALMTGCSSGAPEPTPTASPTTPDTSAPAGETIEDLYQAALDEGGDVVWYSSAPSDTPAKFEAAFPGMKVEFVRLSAGPLGTRYAQERDAGATPSDVIAIADKNFIEDAHAKNWLLPDLSDLPAFADWPADWYDEGIAKLAIAPIGIGYNTDLVPNPPKTWEEAVAPEFQDRMQNGDPRAVPNYLALMYVLQEEYGTEFLEQIADLGTSYQDSTVAINQNIAAGAESISLTNSYQQVQLIAREGGPVEFANLSPTTGPSFFAGISVDAPHPAAARLLMNYLMTVEGQEAFSLDLVSPFGPDKVAGSIEMPDGFRETDVKDVDAARAGILKALRLE